MQFKLAIFALLGSAFAQQATFLQQLESVHHALDSLDVSVKGITAGGDLAAVAKTVISKSEAVLAAMEKAISTIGAASGLDIAGAVALVDPSQHLLKETEVTINDLIAKKEILVTGKLGGTVLGQLKSQQAAAQKLVDAIGGKIPADTRSIVASLGKEISAAINKGIAAFT